MWEVSEEITRRDFSSENPILNVNKPKELILRSIYKQYLKFLLTFF